MDTPLLPAELERFANEAVAQGRFRDVADVIEAGVALLQRFESQRAALLASVIAAEKEGEQEGFLSGDEVEARIRATLGRRAPSAA